MLTEQDTSTEAECKSDRALNASVPPLSDPEMTVARNWVRGMVAQSNARGLFAELVMVTPAIARALLDLNTRNRTVKPGGVEFFETMLRDGSFKTLGRGIAVSKGGVINDGQHRLLAIISTGLSALILIAWGEEDEDFSDHDSGGAGMRSAATVLSLDGIKNAAVVAAAARILMVWGTASPGRRLGNSQVLAFVRSQHPRLIDSATPAAAMGSGLKLPPSPFCVAHYWIATRSKHAELLPIFWENVRDGENLGSGDPALTLRNGLLKRSLTDGVRSGHYKATRTIAGFLLAWNASVKGKRPKSVYWAPPASFPEVV